MATRGFLRRYVFRLKSKWKAEMFHGHSFSSLLIFLYVIFSVLQAVGATKCFHGTFINGTCVCDRGWRGNECQNCYGRIWVNSTNGIVSEGPGNYTVDTKCTWLVYGGDLNTTIHLWLDQFATECSWDHLYVYDGDSVFSPLIAVFSGLLNPRAAKLPEIRTQSGYAFLHFFSDAAYNMSGFSIKFQSSNCPKNCSGNGYCNDTTCHCDPSWQGEACEIPVCPRNCSNHGVCDTVDRKCRCDTGYRGIDCSRPLRDGVWNPVYVKGNFTPMGRASHRAVVLNEYMWVISGSGFGDPGFQNLVRFDIPNRTWKNISPKSALKPLQRYGHSAVIYDNLIYMYGGLVGSRDIVSELWSYNIDTNEWSQQNITGESPVGVVGHTAHVVDDVMHVIFGHSPVYGYVNFVQELDLLTFKWKTTSTTGAIVKGGYGHSSVYDVHQGIIYVHGGYRSLSAATYVLSDDLYGYNPKTKEWKIYESSGSSRYLHSVNIINEMMLVFGGNTHNDSGTSQGAKCYSNSFLAYDLKCDKWYHKDPPNLPWDISRFGHTTVVYDGKLFVFGGFNGLMLNDIYEYTPGSCAAYQGKEACLSATPGIRCVWSDTQGCVHPDEVRSRFEHKTLGDYEKHGCKGKTGDYSEMCKRVESSCPSCLSTSFGCRWCKGGCEIGTCRDPDPVASVEQCPAKYSTDCSFRHNCAYCNASSDCMWVMNRKGSLMCVNREDKLENYPATCSRPCHGMYSCANCTAAHCMWCESERRCVESNAYFASYPYGQCREWVAQNSKCSATQCSELKTCDECQINPSCGWCDDGTNTGLGKCMEGSNSGPIMRQADATTVTPDLCPAPHWFFVDCPVCQCNGHSTCYDGTSKCISCADLTEGNRCERCIEGYYGNATAGGKCFACQCIGQAASCDRVTGSCRAYCRVKGVVGDLCNECEVNSNYIGNGETCHYNLTTDFRFTFNLSKKTDAFFTQISFMNTPTRSDKDVEFMIKCSKYALLNITIRTATRGDIYYVIGETCGLYEARFSHSRYKFATEFENTTFLVDVYNFTTPIWFEISFSQQQMIDLINFFIWFFSCFLSLLLVAAIVWKIKLRYMLYRRRQQMLVQMQHMASRPFASVSIDVTPPDNSLKQLTATPASGVETMTRRKKKPSKPSPITLETCSGQKSGVLTLLIRLPCGDEDHTPNGQTGLAIASALVTMGGHHSKSTAERLKSESRHRIQSKSIACEHNMI